LGPPVTAVAASESALEGFTCADVASQVGGGGGSITCDPGDGPDRGSGSSGIGSSAEDVSIVICLVVTGV